MGETPKAPKKISISSYGVMCTCHLQAEKNTFHGVTRGFGSQKGETCSAPLTKSRPRHCVRSQDKRIRNPPSWIIHQTSMVLRGPANRRKQNALRASSESRGGDGAFDIRERHLPEAFHCQNSLALVDSPWISALAKSRICPLRFEGPCRPCWRGSESSPHHMNKNNSGPFAPVASQYCSTVQPPSGKILAAVLVLSHLSLSLPRTEPAPLANP